MIEKSVLRRFLPTNAEEHCQSKFCLSKEAGDRHNCSLQCQALGLEKAKAVLFASTIPGFPGGIRWCQSNEKKTKAWRKRLEMVFVTDASEPLDFGHKT